MEMQKESVSNLKNVWICLNLPLVSFYELMLSVTRMSLCLSVCLST